MPEHQGVTVFVPALNEEKNLPLAIENVITAAKKAGDATIEILIVNDGSTDGTASIIEEFEKKHPVIRSIHHRQNTGWGVSFQEALQEARYPKIALYPGDGMLSASTLCDMIRHAYAADFVCAFAVNKDCRSKFRNFISSIYTRIFIYTFNIPLKYINAAPVYPVALLRKLKLRSRRYSFPSEVTVKVLRSGCRFIEIPGSHDPRNMKSSALRIKNLVEVVVNYFLLIIDIYIRYRQEYSKSPVRVVASPDFNI